MYICRCLISLSLKNPNLLCRYKSHISPFSISSFFSSSTSKQVRIPIADYLIHHHQFSPEAVSKFSSPVKYLKDPEKSDSIVSFLKESGFSRTHLEQLIKRFPTVLSSNLDRTIKPKIKFFQDLDFSPTDIAEIISANPLIFARSTENRLRPSVSALKSVVGSDVAVLRVLKVSSWFLKSDLEKTMIPNIEFMKSCGISCSQIVKYVYNYPRLFLLKPESIKDIVKRIDDFGLDRKSKMFLPAIRVIGSLTVENWELKLELFRSLGFSEDDIASVFRKMPQVFAGSERKIKEVTQIMTGKFDTSSIVNNPKLLLCSVENRLKPRLRVLEVLESKNLLPSKPSLATACSISHKKFFDKFVLPYSDEVGKIYILNEV